MNTKKSRLLCLFSGPFITGLRSAICSQGKAAHPDEWSGHHALPVWTLSVTQGSPWADSGPGHRELVLWNLLLSLPPSLPAPPQLVGVFSLWAWCPPQGEHPGSQSVEVPRPLGAGRRLYIPLPQSRKCKFLGWALRPLTQDLRPCSVRSENPIPQMQTLFSWCRRTRCDGDISASFRLLHIGFYALSKVTAALNGNVL